MTDLPQPGGKRQFADALKRQGGEGRDSVAQVAERLVEGALLVDIRAFDGSRVLDAPMRRHGLPRPDGTDFARRVVANGEHEIHLRRARSGIFVPALGAEILRRVAVGGERLQRVGVHRRLSAGCPRRRR